MTCESGGVGDHRFDPGSVEYPEHFVGGSAGHGQADYEAAGWPDLLQAQRSSARAPDIEMFPSRARGRSVTTATARTRVEPCPASQCRSSSGVASPATTAPMSCSPLIRLSIPHTTAARTFGWASNRARIGVGSMRFPPRMISSSALPAMTKVPSLFSRAMSPVSYGPCGSRSSEPSA